MTESRFRTLLRVAVTTGAESIGVAVAAMSGFLIVHQLSKPLYSQYTFLITCATFAVGLSDLGLSHCYLPVVGERASEIRWVRGACRRVYQLRWYLLVPALLVIALYWARVTVQHQWNSVGFYTASLLFLGSALLTIREQALKNILIIVRAIRKLNRIGVIANCARLALILFVLSAGPEWLLLVGLAVAAIFGTAVALTQYSRVDSLKNFNEAALTSVERQTVDQTIKKIMTPMILPVLFYQVQGTISIFLVSLLAPSSAIAEVGALTRPALILVVVDRVTGILLFPAIARQSDPNAMRQTILRAHALYLLLMLVLFTSSIWGARFWMLLIGAQYAQEQPLLWLAFLSAILMNASGFAFTTLSSRGITARQSVLIPLVLSVQAVVIWMFGVASTKDALRLSVATAGVFFLFQYAMLFFNFGSLHAGLQSDD